MCPRLASTPAAIKMFLNFSTEIRVLVDLFKNLKQNQRHICWNIFILQWQQNIFNQNYLAHFEHDQRKIIEGNHFFNHVPIG